jgi:hypothetical protein
MKILFFFISLLTIHFSKGIVRDLSGLYNLDSCSCTVLRCLPSYIYEFNQSQNGELRIYIHSNILAGRGQTISINNGQELHLFIEWLPGMDFDTNCTGHWLPLKKSIEFKCGNQNRYCTGQFSCRQNSGPCDKNNANALYINTLQKIIISSIFLLLI